MKLSVVLPLLLPDKFTEALTRFCIESLYIHAKEEFELVIVETGTRYFEKLADKYIHIPGGSTYVKDWNIGADVANGEYLVHIGNDVIVGPGWDAALIEPFEKYRDCGVSCTSAIEPGAGPIGHDKPIPGLIVEGMFAPMMCFRKGWKLDEAYEGGYSDSDLIMRIYTEGLRAYRNYASVCWHMRMVTWNRTPDNGQGQVERGEDTFYARWKNSPLWMYSMIRGAKVQYAQEHLARVAMTPSDMRAKK